MAKKRKQDSQVTEPTEPPKKQQQKQKQKEEIMELVPEEEEYEEVEEEEEDGEEEEEVEEEEEAEEEEEEEEEEEDDDDGDDQNQIDDEDDESLDKLLEPFSKEQLINLIRYAADTHGDIADRIRKIADEDPVHRKIFVHGLGWDTNTETLMNAFKPYGEIEDCKAVCDKVSGKSKGYGFILFKKRSGASKALKEPQKKIGNRMTACQLASIGPVPAAGAATPAHQQVSEYTLRKIYVSNVGSDLDPHKLTAFFAKYGEIEEGPLGLDKATGKPKGFCLFVYRTVESAKKALEEPHKNFEGHILHCQKAIDGPKPGKSMQQQQQQQQQQHHVQNSHFQRNDNPAYAGGVASGPAHLMAPSAAPGIGFNQGAGAAAAPALNPALGQALTALLATQGAGLGLTNLLGTLGSAASVNQGGVPGAAPGMQSAYGSQANISPGVIGSYGNHGVMQGGYSNQQLGQGGSGRGHGVGQYGGVAPYMGH